jgi:alpha-methylacyl-CoA racemase
LDGIRVLEIGGVGPLPFAGMLLAEMGAEVIRVERPRAEPLFAADPRADLLNRGKRSVLLDLKRSGAVDALLRLVSGSDVMIEGFRPGTAERMGIGPDVCLERNPAVVYGRMTGWGQSGPLAARAGHDINYIGLSGALAASGDEGERPQVPLNLVGDIGGGAMYLVSGVLAALLSAGRTGVGRVVDAAIVDGVAHSMLSAVALAQVGWWSTHRGANLLDGGAPFYRVYETSDKKFVTVGAIEPKFFEELVAGLGLTFDLSLQYDRVAWPELTERMVAAFASKSRAEWSELFAESDACVWPVLDLDEAARHPHLQARGTFLDSGTGLQPAPAPRFDGVDRAIPDRIDPGRDSVELLSGLGIDTTELLENGALSNFLV